MPTARGLTVPDLPEDPAQYLEYIKALNLFETASYSGADQGRTRQYQEEAGRVALQSQFSDYGEYLESLEMTAEVKAFDSFHFPRIAQLTQRSNQFNLRTVRYTEQEIAELAEDENHLTMYFTLRDRFGDYGLISVAVLDKLEDKTIFISEWLMSCRVLKRGMEEFIMDEMIRAAGKNGFDMVVGEYLPTAKNKMVEDLYSRMGLQSMGNGRFTVRVRDYIMHETYIRRQ